MTFRGRVLAPVLITLTVVLAVTGLVASPASAAPVVSSFTPTSGGVGSPLTITGSGFTSVTSVKFNATAAIYTVVSATQIKTTVPAGATTGKISVTAGGVTGSSSTNFTVTLGAAVTPAAGPPTSKVTVNGSGFGANEAVDVYAGTTDVALAISDANGNLSVPVTVPASAPPGAFWFRLVGRRSGTAAQAAFTVRTNVAQSGLNALKQSWNRYENTITVSSAGSLESAWSQPGDTPPAIVNGVALTVLSPEVRAYTTATGALRWSPSVAGVEDVTPAVVGNTVVVVTGDGKVVGLSLTSGAVQWTRQLQTTAPITSAPTTTASGIYVVQTDGRVTALTASGLPVWSKTMDTTATHGGVAVSASEGVVVTGDDAGKTYFWNLGDGTFKDSALLVGSASPLLTPVVSGDDVIVSAISGEIDDRDLGTGYRDWYVTMPSGIGNAPAVGNNRVYVALTDSLVALARVNGATVWTSTDARFYSATPFLAGTVLWALDGLSHYVAVDPATGAAVGSVSAYTRETDRAVVSDGVLYVVDSLTHLVKAFRLPDATASARPSISSLRPDRSLRR